MCSTVISLIGHQNVGKSTLFNKLTNSNDALTANFPGLTRDRRYSNIEIKKKSFTIIDTGGICYTSKSENIQKKIIYQSIIAIKESDIVLCILDAQTGIIKDDYEIIELIRNKNKYFIVIVNKIDGINLNYLNEFYSLKVNKIIFISAINNIGIKYLIKNILKLKNKINKNYNNIINKNYINKKNKNIYIKISIIGMPNSGKSTLLNCFFKKNRTIVSKEPFTTRDSIYVPLKFKNKNYLFIDTAGIRKKNKIKLIEEKFSVDQTINSIKDSNIVLLIIDANKGLSNQDIILCHIIINKGKSLIIIINKWDLISIYKKKIIKSFLKKNLYIFNFFRIHFISALYNKKISNIFNSINEAYSNSKNNINTSLITNIMKEAIKKHKPPLVGKKKINFKYSHMIENNPFILKIYGKRVSLIPNFYKRYLINYFHKSLKIIGTPINIQFQEIFNKNKRIKIYNNF
ncbi:ribosome biogenesis GTPase Der [Sodalis-like secondary symbiont of Drepanosiphum platanoidis]|uniref:ribosome biogenesis GTPase Der n=1 Tax=Sodalis-like secondary symbiont of Drepanosiphum platanoidis TaxID=2994493 RepID=UPI003464B8B8